jgi:hypothetical protein
MLNPEQKYFRAGSFQHLYFSSSQTPKRVRGDSLGVFEMSSDLSKEFSYGARIE